MNTENFNVGDRVRFLEPRRLGDGKNEEILLNDEGTVSSKSDSALWVILDRLAVPVPQVRLTGEEWEPRFAKISDR